MQVKTFTGKSNAAVLDQIKSAMGEKAIILDTHKANGLVVMTAALERSNSAKKTSSKEEDLLFPFDSTSPFPRSHTRWHEEWTSIKQHIMTLLQPAVRFEELEPRQKLALEYLQQEGACDEALLELFCMLKKKESCSVLEALDKIVPTKALTQDNWIEKIHFFTGPFGVGKTSMTLKTALFFRQQNPRLRICIVNADAQRANGRLFLKHYAELSQLHYVEVHSAMELGGVFAKLSSQSFDLICVDMPGLNRKECLSDYFMGILPDEQSFFGASWQRICAAHLVLSPHVDRSFIDQLLLRYTSPFLSSIIYTKLDELERFGQILSIGKKIRLPISAFSYSPSLTGALKPAVSSHLWRMLFRRELPNTENNI